MQRRRNIALGRRDQFALQHLLPDQHDRPRRRPDVLRQHQVEAWGHRQLAYRLIGRRPGYAVDLEAVIAARSAAFEILGGQSVAIGAAHLLSTRFAIERRFPGFVDAYFGPTELKERANDGPTRPRRGARKPAPSGDPGDDLPF